MQKLLAWALLAVVPFSSLRMVCLNPHTLVALAGGDVSLPAGDEPPACDEFCPMPPGDTGGQAASAEASPDAAAAAQRRASAAAERQTGEEETCLLVADPTCALLLTGDTAAVLPAEPSLAVASVAVAYEAAQRPTYTPPSLSQFTPPPEA